MAIHLCEIFLKSSFKITEIKFTLMKGKGVYDRKKLFEYQLSDFLKLITSK